MSALSSFNGAKTIVGLGSYTYIAATTESHVAKVSSTIATTPSTLSVTIAQSGSNTASVSSTISNPAQNVLKVIGAFPCVAGDVITYTFASSTPSDAGLNTVKSLLGLHGGSTN